MVVKAVSWTHLPIREGSLPKFPYFGRILVIDDLGGSINACPTLGLTSSTLLRVKLKLQPGTQQYRLGKERELHLIKWQSNSKLKVQTFTHSMASHQ